MNFVPVEADSTNERAHRQKLADATRQLQKVVGGRITSAAQAITLGGLITIPHTFGVAPFNVALDLQCVDAGGEGGFAQNDISQNVSAGAIYTDTTSINLRVVSAGISIARKDTGAAFTLTPAKWNLIVKAFR